MNKQEQPPTILRIDLTEGHVHRCKFPKQDDSQDPWEWIAYVTFSISQKSGVNRVYFNKGFEGFFQVPALRKNDIIEVGVNERRHKYRGYYAVLESSSERLTLIECKPPTAEKQEFATSKFTVFTDEELEKELTARGYIVSLPQTEDFALPTHALPSLEVAA